MKRFLLSAFCVLLGFGIGVAVPRHQAPAVQPAVQATHAKFADVRCYDEKGKQLPDNDPLGIR